MAENHPLDAVHPYGTSKIATDRMCYSYMKTYGLNVNIVRLFNAFGPRQKDSGYGGVISIFVKRVLAGMPPIIYGDGLQTRDYTYIEDVVNAFEVVLCWEGDQVGPVNFGNGKIFQFLNWQTES